MVKVKSSTVALRHSRILRSASSFAKCTGKLWVTNFAYCLRGFNGVAAFDFRGLWKPTLIDSMFYIVGTDFYASRIARLHEAVDDDNGYYLEHAFRDGLRDLPPSRYVMYPTPRIVGCRLDRRSPRPAAFACAHARLAFWHRTGTLLERSEWVSL